MTDLADDRQQDYFDGQPGGCPYKNKLDADGSCASHFNADTPSDFCVAYCEVKNSYFYGQEIPFNEFSSCRANEPCTFTSTDALTITQTYTFNTGISLKKRDQDQELNDTLVKRDDDLLGGLKIGFNAGASYSWSTATTTSTGLALSRPTDKMANCGYWTFVPYFWTSCGSVSTATLQTNWYSGSFSCESDVKTTGNYCNSYVSRGRTISLGPATLTFPLTAIPRRQW